MQLESRAAILADEEVVEFSPAISREDAFHRLADRHLDASYRLARAILGNHAEAEDATHDAFVTAWRNWSNLRDPSRFDHWFERILVNTCRNRLRSSAHRRMLDITPELELIGAETTGATHERDRIGVALRQLAPDDRLVLALRFYRDLKVDEIARCLAIRSGTVKSRLHYALRRLHAVLDEAEGREAL